MKKVLYVVGGLVALVVVAALVAPFFIDLNDYKGEIEAKAKEATGRDLKIDGKISLSILPLPSVTVDGIKFGNAPGGTAPNMAEIESATVKVAIMPLLSHKAQITDITLTRPVIVLEKLKDGTGNWVLNPQAASGTATTPEPAPAQPAPAQPTSDGATASAGGWDVQVDGATVEDGTFIYRDAATGSEQKIEKINVGLNMASLKGPFEAEGGLVAMNLPLGFSAKIGRMDPSAPMPIDLTLNVGENKGSFGFSGQADMAAAGDPAKPIVIGKLSAKAENVAELMAALSGGSPSAQPPALARPFALNGDVTAGSAAAEIKNLALTLGDIAAQGSVGAKFGEAATVDANLAVGRIDLDKLLPAQTGDAAAKKTDAAPSGDAKAAAPFTLPTGITANLTTTIEQIAYQGKAIDGSKLVAQLKDGALNLTQLSAQLPGNTAFTLSGVLAAKSGQPSFTGAVKASSDNLREVAEMFAKGALDSVPADRLRKLALTSRLNASPAQIEVADLNATLDASKISGGVIVALPDNASRKRMAFGVGLSIDKLVVDGYLPQGDKKAAAASTASNDNTKKAAPANPLKALAPLGDLDANIELKAGTLTMNEKQIKNLHVLIGLADGTLDIKDLSVKELMGGSGKVTGKVVDLKGDPKFDVNFDVSAKDAGGVLQMAGMDTGKSGKFGSLNLEGKASGNANDVTFDVAMAMTGVGLDGTAKGTASGLMAGGIPKINSTFDIKAKDTASLAQLFGGPVDAAKQLGAVAFAGTAQSGADDLTYDVSLSIGGIGGSGKLAGKVTGISATPQVDTTLDLKVAQPKPLLQLAGIAGPKAEAMGTLTAAGALKGNAENMDLNLDLSAAGATAKVAGNVKMPKSADPAKPEPIGFDLSVTANHPEFTDLMKIADLPSSGAKGGPLAIAMKAAGTTKKASVSQIDAKWGDSSLVGSANYDATGAKPNITASLSGGTVNLVPFMGAAPKGNAPKSTGGDAAGKSGPWSNEKLDLSALGNQDADIDFKAKSLIMPDQRIDDLVAKITIKGGLMTMQTLSGKIYGGGFDLSGTSVNGNGTPKIDAKVAVQAIQLAELLGGGIAGSQVKGPISLNFDGTGSGLSQADIVRSLTGKGNLDGTVLIIGKIEQTVGSALLGVLGQKVKAVQGIAEKINGVLASYTGVDNKLTGTFDIANGVLDTQDTAFTNPRASGTAKGKVDIAQMALNLLVDLFGADAQQAFMSVNLNGPLSSPKPSFSGGGAAPSASGIPGLNIPGLNLPGLGGGATGTSAEPGGAATGVPGLGGAAGSAVGGALGGTGGAAVGGAAGGLLNDVLGGKKKQEQQQEPQQAPASQESAPAAEPGAAGTAPAAQPEAAPAEPAPAEPAPAATEQAPAAEPAPATEEAPAAEPGAAPTEPAPAEQAPAEQAPAEQAPAEQAPAEQAPAEQAPAEQTPGELVPLPNNETTTEPAGEPGASGN